jgi:hypothetical protein
MREAFITYLLVCWIVHIVLMYLAMGENDENE